MLTASEREWLADRKHKAYCRYCSSSKLCANPFASGFSCPLAAGNMKDALEFSERVAAKLADAYWPPLVYTPVAPFEQLFMPPMDRLKWARIEVEKEMDNADSQV